MFSLNTKRRIVALLAILLLATFLVVAYLEIAHSG